MFDQILIVNDKNRLEINVRTLICCFLYRQCMVTVTVTTNWKDQDLIGAGAHALQDIAMQLASRDLCNQLLDKHSEVSSN